MQKMKAYPHRTTILLWLPCVKCKMRFRGDFSGTGLYILVPVRWMLYAPAYQDLFGQLHAPGSMRTVWGRPFTIPTWQTTTVQSKVNSIALLWNEWEWRLKARPNMQHRCTINSCTIQLFFHFMAVCYTLSNYINKPAVLRVWPWHIHQRTQTTGYQKTWGKEKVKVI